MMIEWRYGRVMDTESKRVYITEIFFDENGAPALFGEAAVSLEGYDWESFTEDTNDTNKMNEDLDNLVIRLTNDLADGRVYVYPDDFTGDILGDDDLEYVDTLTKEEFDDWLEQLSEGLDKEDMPMETKIEAAIDKIVKDNAECIRRLKDDDKEEN